MNNAEYIFEDALSRFLSQGMAQDELDGMDYENRIWLIGEPYQKIGYCFLRVRIPNLSCLSWMHSSWECITCTRYRAIETFFGDEQDHYEVEIVAPVEYK